MQEAADDVAKMRAQSDRELTEARDEVEQARKALRSERMLLRQQLTHLLEHARRLEMDAGVPGLGAGDWSQAPLEITPVTPETNEGRGRLEQLATSGPTKVIGRLLPPVASPVNGADGGPVDEPIERRAEGEMQDRAEALDETVDQDEPDQAAEADT